MWEELTAVRDRAQASLRHYIDYQVVFVVCHGAVVRSLIGETIDLADYRPYKLPAASS